MFDGNTVCVCVLSKYSPVIVADDNLKSYHVSTRTEFIWGGVNLRVKLCLIQFILVLP